MMLTDAPTRLAPEGVEWEMGGGVPWARLRGWAHATPADAIAALVETELLPEHWSDPERAPRWWCEQCQGRGLMAASLAGGWMCDACRSHTHTAAPPSHAALVAVASLGVDTLARAEAIAAAHHPRWWQLSDAARRLHTRNVFQVLGDDLASPSEFVVCWTPRGDLVGGTAQALRIAATYGVPIANLGSPLGHQKLKDILNRSQQSC
jgi:hypothetical protein